MNQIGMIGIQILADTRINTGRSSTGGFDGFRFAADTVHVSGRSAEVGYHAGEAGYSIAHDLDFTNNGIF